MRSRRGSRYVCAASCPGINVMIPTGIKQYFVDENAHGERLDVFLAFQEPDYSRSYWQKICRQGYVVVDGYVQRKPGFTLKVDQSVEVTIPSPQGMVAEPEEIALDIIYEDRELLVINKPKGMVVHPAAGHRSGTLVNALLFYCKELPVMGEKLRPGIVHRLDKDTTGLLVVAKNEGSFIHLSQQIKNRNMKRQYLAIVHGQPQRVSGTIALPLGRDRTDRKRIAVQEDGSGRRAVTHYQTLKTFGSFSLLLLKLETGRTHQIRVHLAYIHCPVVGDPTYGPKKSPYREMGQLLHAQTLGFFHPGTKKYMEFTVDPGEDFTTFLAGREADGLL